MREIFIGTSDFQKFRKNDSYYVDKSLFIQQVLQLRSEVALIPRPRRFGKTLNISMLRYYFERSEESRQGLFTDLAIWQQGEKYTKLQGTMPVIYISFKDAKGETWEKTYHHIRNVLMEEYLRHESVLQGTLKRVEQKEFDAICEGTAQEEDFEGSLKKLSQWLQRAYGTQGVLLLIDEYDTPIHQSYVHRFYQKCISFMRALLGSALKDNSSLDRAVLTGILRVAKESIFSGLNNVRVCSILSDAFERSFGLLDAEVETALRDFGREQEMDDFRRWYNGYVFGRETVYNPWSIFHALAEPRRPLQPYWVHTGDTTLLEQVMDASRHNIMENIHMLMEGKAIQATIDEHISFGDLANHIESLWSFLVFSGYLKAGDVHYKDNGNIIAKLRIPNNEVSYVFTKIVQRWVLHPTQTHDPMLHGLLVGDDAVFIQGFQKYVAETFSYFDVHAMKKEVKHAEKKTSRNARKSKQKNEGAHEEENKAKNENVYHMFVLGMMIQLRDTYEVFSNRESGKGRYDMALIPRNVQTHPRGFVLAFKEVEKEAQLAQSVAFALQQITNKAYDTELTKRNVPHIVHIGIAFAEKQTSVGMEHRK